MATRKAFLVSIAAGSAAVAAPGGAANPAASASPAPTMTPSPKTTPTPKPPSPAASAWAARMRDFDKTLSDDELASIATAIDQSYDLGKAINPKGRRLKNSDEPVSPFEVES
jgi:hypothetical protein